MDEGILYGLMAFSTLLGGGGFVGGLLKRSLFWALFPFFGALIAWETYVQLGADGQITVAYLSNGTPVPASPTIMAVLLGFLIIINFLIMFIIGVKKGKV